MCTGTGSLCPFSVESGIVGLVGVSDDVSALSMRPMPIIPSDKVSGLGLLVWIGEDRSRTPASIKWDLGGVNSSSEASHCCSGTKAVVR